MSWNLSKSHSPAMLIVLAGFNIAMMIEIDTVTRNIAIVKATTSMDSSCFESFPNVDSSSGLGCCPDIDSFTDGFYLKSQPAFLLFKK